MPTKQHWNIIHSPWILKHWTHTVNDLCAHEFVYLTLIINKNPMVYSYYNYNVFPLTFTVFLRIQNTFRKIRKSISRFLALFKFPFCSGFSLHLQKKGMYGKKLYTSCELSKVYRMSRMLTSIHCVYWMGEHKELRRSITK